MSNWLEKGGTPAPWSDTTTIAIPAYDRRLICNGHPFPVAVRVLSEENWQAAKAAVNAVHAQATASSDDLLQRGEAYLRTAPPNFPEGVNLIRELLARLIVIGGHLGECERQFQDKVAEVGAVTQELAQLRAAARLAYDEAEAAWIEPAVRPVAAADGAAIIAGFDAAGRVVDTQAREYEPVAAPLEGDDGAAVVAAVDLKHVAPHDDALAAGVRVVTPENPTGAATRLERLIDDWLTLSRVRAAPVSCRLLRSMLIEAYPDIERSGGSMAEAEEIPPWTDTSPVCKCERGGMKPIKRDNPDDVRCGRCGGFPF